MTDTTAKIRAKGLDSTGVTEDIAAQMYAHRGRTYMAIVEVRVDETHQKADGTRKVDLTLEQVEPAEHGSPLADHLRELTRTCYANRAHADGQAAIDDTLTPDIGEAVKAGAVFEPHPFIPTDAANDTPICDRCGALELAAVHAVYSTNSDVEPAPPQHGVDDQLDLEPELSAMT